MRNDAVFVLILSIPHLLHRLCIRKVVREGRLRVLTTERSVPRIALIRIPPVVRRLSIHPVVPAAPTSTIPRAAHVVATIVDIHLVLAIIPALWSPPCTTASVLLTVPTFALILLISRLGTRGTEWCG